MSTLHLHPHRVFWLLRLALRRRGRFVGLLLLAGILLYLGLHLVLSYHGLTENAAVLPFGLVVVLGAGLGGIALACDAFQQRQTRPAQDFHLGLPATRLELLVAQCVLLGVLYPAAVFVAATLAAVGAPALAGLFFDQVGSFVWADHLRKYWQVFVPGLLVFEAIFLLGSAYFRSNALSKTWAAACVVGFCVMISAFAAGYAAFRMADGHFSMKIGVIEVSAKEPVLPAGEAIGKDANSEPAEEQVRRQEQAAGEQWEAFAEAVAATEQNPWLERQLWWGRFVLLPLFCLAVAYVRLREQEA
jgi:hypothetical protein